jgi:hypothetical protein
MLTRRKIISTDENGLGKSSGAGSPDKMKELAIQNHRKYTPGQRAIAKSFA